MGGPEDGVGVHTTILYVAESIKRFKINMGEIVTK